MKIAWILCFLTGGLTAYLAWGPCGVQSGSDLVLEPAACDFGIIPLGGEQTRLVQLHNRGSGELTVVSIAKSCSCAALSLDRDRIPPGEFATLAIRMMGRSSPPTLNHVLSLTTQRPGQAERICELKVTAEVLQSVEAIPTRLDFGEIELNRAAEREIEFYFTDRTINSLLKMEFATDEFEYQILPATSPNRVRCRVTLTARRHASERKSEITVHTGDFACPRIVVPVTATVKSSFHCVPPRIAFSPLRGDGEFKCGLSIRSSHPNAIKSVKAPTHVTVKEIVSSDSCESKYEIVVANTNSLKAFVMKDEIVFQTVNESEPELRIPVSGLMVKSTADGDRQ